MRKFSNKKLAAVAVAAVALTGTGVAYAYWTTTGGGSGTSATNAGVADIDVTQQSSPSQLAPGIAPDAVTATITNNSAAAAGYVNDLTVTVGAPYVLVPDGPDVDSDPDQQVVVLCDATNFGLVAGSTAATPLVSGAQTITMPVETDLAAAGGNVPAPNFELGFINKATDQDACKSVIVPLGYTTD